MGITKQLMLDEMDAKDRIDGLVIEVDGKPALALDERIQVYKDEYGVVQWDLSMLDAVDMEEAVKSIEMFLARLKEESSVN